MSRISEYANFSLISRLDIKISYIFKNSDYIFLTYMFYSCLGGEMDQPEKRQIGVSLLNSNSF